MNLHWFKHHTCPEDEEEATLLVDVETETVPESTATSYITVSRVNTSSPSTRMAEPARGSTRRNVNLPSESRPCLGEKHHPFSSGQHYYSHLIRRQLH